MFWQDVIVDRILTKAELSDVFSKVFQVDDAKIDITSSIEHSLGVGFMDIVCETRKCGAEYPQILSIFLKNELERETHDPKDALVIADVISRGYYYEYSRQAIVFQRLRTMMSDREFWVTNSVRLQNRIIRWLDIRFPEYFSVFKDWTCKRSLAALKEFPSPQDLASLSVSELITGWRAHMKRAGGSTGMQKAAQLIAQAKSSIGETTALKEAKQDLQWLLKEFERIVEILERIEQDIQVLLSEIPMADHLRSIGLGTICIAAILSGAGDLRQYADGRQLLRKASLNLAESTSGKRKGQIVLSKRGDATLRKYLYLAKLQLVGIIIGIVRRGETFSHEKAAPTCIQAA